MTKLGIGVQESGQWKGAEKLLVQVMENHKRVLCTEYLDTLFSMKHKNSVQLS